MKRPFSDLAAVLPPDGAALHRLGRVLADFSPKLVVLDDDPTGVQTVHDVPVYTDWEQESLDAAMAEEGRLFFLLTNSRGLSPEKTVEVHRTIAQRVAAAAARAGRDYLLISRSDSTLRGYYPQETDALRTATEACGLPPFDGEILLPFFPEGGRYTLDNIHYVREGAYLVPAGETEFARDRTFGYRSSDLTAWVEEKTGGAVRAEAVVTVPLAMLRSGSADAVAALLGSLQGYRRVVVNAADYADVAVFCEGLIAAMRQGKRFLFRTAAALPKILGGVADRPLLQRADILAGQSKHGGLVVVGSHVRRTTEQLEALRTLPGLCMLEFDQHTVLREGGLAAEQARVAALLQQHIAAGETCVVYTRRERLDAASGDPQDDLRLAAAISASLTALVAGLTVRPAFLIAKGGITSSDIGTVGLSVRRATVAGQIRPGIPVWRTGAESRFPHMAYVIFPGNVGGPDTLREIVQELL